jgi:deoxyribonuclease-2
MRFLLPFLSCVFAIQCKDEVGNDIPGWEILKFPQSTSYVYSTSTQPSMFNLNSTTEGALAHTMQQMWLADTDYMVYNDEPPFATDYNFTVAHAKAVFVWNNASGFALFHSIPKFPVSPNMSPYYSGLLQNAWEYAQHIVCMNLQTTDIQQVLPLLASLNPQIYGGIIPVATLIPDIQCTIHFLGNRILFAKPASYEVDIWSACVASYFASSLQVISWVHGTLDGPACSQTSTVDITTIEYLFGESYSNYNNHAKWGIGVEPLVCFGDLNRVTTQKTRSGAVLCWKDVELYNALSQTIASTNSCD